MDYARYDNQAAQASSWEPDQTAPIMQPQPQQVQPQATIKPDPQTAQPILYGAPAHQPIASYDMPVEWTPQVVPQNVIQVPQWPPSSAPVGHTVTHVDPIGSQPVSDACLHPSPRQSHYTQYSTLPGASTYWNPDFVNSQPQTLGPQPTTAGSLPAGPQNRPSDHQNLIDNTFTLNQPSVPEVVPPVSLAPTTGPQQQQPPPPPPPTSQFDDQLAIGTSSQVEQLPSGIPGEGPGSLEDALEVIKSHAEHFSGPRHTCSSTSGDDDDDLSRGPRSGEREKERRQANNARER